MEREEALQAEQATVLARGQEDEAYEAAFRDLLKQVAAGLSKVSPPALISFGSACRHGEE
ncbi:hypothetical protein DA2_0728 [Desulfovibrio sp. A2]|nr:hypothetical protein DA2_0728 [Desulfovibrio sp. A2]